MNKDIQLPFQNSHAFIIGINDYLHLSPLSTAVNDAKKLADQLSTLHGYTIHGPYLNSTKADLLHLFHEEMIQAVQAKDRVLIYFAGHGIALDSDDNPKGYLVPVDAKGGDPTSLVPMDLIHDTISKLPCQHGLLILDCCFAGSFKWSTGFRDLVFDLPGIIYEERFFQYAQDPAWQVITSSASDQKAVDILSNRTLGLRNQDGEKHSPFALALLDGLAGEADTVPKDRGDGVITATELYTYLRDRVEDETSAQSQRQSPSMFSLHRHDKGQYIFFHPTHRLNLPPIPRCNPFMGLKSYNENDHKLFYGRDRVIESLYSLSQKQQFIVVSGASGTGKSSVIKAGLLPLLRKNGWDILPIIRPGKEPMTILNTELKDLPLNIAADKPSLLIIDQYEELITQCLDTADRLAFEQQLVNWLKAHPQLHIVISIRSDFEPQFENGGLADYWQEGRYVVPAFSQDELREVIIKPTVQEVLFFEPPSLVDKLVDAVNQAPGALPLLSFTLSELYHQYINSGRTNRAFTLADYEQLGGVIGALRTRANAIYDELDPAFQNSMRKLMLRMVSIEGGELASRRVLGEELVFTDKKESKRMQQVANQLVEARLVSSGIDNQGRTYYEPAHDALVRAWARLWEWIKTMGEGKLDLMFKLNLAVLDYRKHQHHPTSNQYLWDDDPRLDLAFADLKTNHNLNAQEETFVRESMGLREKNKKRRQTLIGLVIGVLLMITGVAVYAKNQAERQADLSEALRLANIATQLAKENNFTDALQVANIAYKTADYPQPPETYQAFLDIFNEGFENKVPIQILELDVSPPLINKNYISPLTIQRPKVQFLPSPTRQQFLVLGDSVKLWSFTGQLLAKLERQQDTITKAVFSPSGDLILTQATDKSVRLYDIKGNHLANLNKHKHSISTASFSPNEDRLLTSSNDYTAKVWDLEGNVLKTLKKHTDKVYAACFSPDGNLILTSSYDSTALLWTSEGNLVQSFEHDPIDSGYTFERPSTIPEYFQPSSYPAVFSPEKKNIITYQYPSTDDTGTVKVWNHQRDLVKSFSHNFDAGSPIFLPTKDAILKTPRIEKENALKNDYDNLRYSDRINDDNLNFASLSPIGNHILTLSESNLARLWTIDENQVTNFNLHQELIETAAFSPDGSFLLTLSTDHKTINLWDTTGHINTTIKIQDKTEGSYKDLFRFESISSAYFSATGNHLLIGTRSKAIILKFQNTPSVSLKHKDHDINKATFSPQGNLLLTYDFSDVALWDLEGNLQFGPRNFVIDGDINSAVFSPEGTKILVSTGDKETNLWDFTNGLSSLELKHKSKACKSTFSPNGKMIITQNAPGVTITTLDKKPIPGKLSEFLQTASKAIISPNNKKILTFSRKDEVNLWDLQGNPITNFGSYSTSFSTAFFSEDNSKIITTTKDGKIMIWNSQGKLLKDLGRVQASISDAKLSKDGSKILTQYDETVKIWSLKGKLLLDFESLNESVKAAEFSPNGLIVLTFNSEMTKLWDIKGNLLGILDGCSKASFSPDGTRIMTTTNDGNTKIWPTPTFVASWVDQLQLVPISNEQKQKYRIK